MPDDEQAGRNVCLRALGIAIDTTVEEGGRWYASTKNLQILCVELCLTCRACWNYPSGPVLVTADTPRHLWLRDKEEGVPKMQQELDAPRVPPLVVRAVKVLEFPETIQARLAEGDRRSRAKQQAGMMARAIRYCQYWFRRGPLWWPDTLMELTFEAEFNETIAGIVWPASLQGLTLGRDFNQPILGVVWPTSLKRLSFGYQFDQPVAEVVWPSGLQRLSFGCRFSKPITGVVWPASLQQLSFRNGAMVQGAFNRHIRVPRGTLGFYNQGCEVCIIQLMLGSRFNEDIIEVVWPASLQELSFGEYFNKPLVGVAWPASLHHLSFGRCFNQSITGVVWPASLRQLSFRNGFFMFTSANHRPVHPPAHRCVASGRQGRMGSKFNQPIEGVAWPSSLKQLSFGHAFNQPIVRVVWPASLKQLSFGKKFNQPIAGVLWPDSLQHLSFGDDFNLPLARVVWPDSLQTLSVGKGFTQPTSGIVWPASLRLRRVLGDPPSIVGSSQEGH